MADVARAARVSVMAVSLALRQSPRLPEATRRRIRAVADQLGYRRNPLVAALMTRIRQRRGPSGPGGATLAYVDSLPPPTVDPTHARADLAGARERAEAQGFRLEVFPLGPHGLTEARLVAVLRARGITGVMFGPMPGALTTLTQDWSGFAAAAVGFTILAPPLHRAVNFQADSLRRAVEAAWGLGYRRIGFAVSASSHHRVGGIWTAAFLLERHQRRGRGVTFPLLMAEELHLAAVRAWLRRERPEVVLSSDFPLLEWAATGRLPVRCIALHLAPAFRRLAGIEQNNREVGAAAVDLVIEQLHAGAVGPPRHPKTVMIQGCWEPGPPGALPRRKPPAA